MSPPRWSPPNRAAIAILFLAFASQTWALTMQYCSSDNTASTNRNTSIYQSNGLCYQFCLDDYAFAVLQGSGCWCSDFVPGDTESTSDCNTKCPGYPEELCGGNNLFGYIALTKSPSGTQGASTSTTARQTSATSTPTTSTTAEAATTEAPQTTTEATTSTTESSTSSSWTPTPVTSLETVTNGLVRTITVTPTSPPQQASSTSTPDSGKSDGLSTGGAVGLTIGLVALVALIGAIIFFYYRKKRKEKEAALANQEIPERRDSGGTGGGVPSRTMSENSRYMLGTDGRQLVEAWETDAGSRTSRLVPIDPRLNPFSGPYLSGSKSRESVNTLRDDHDYSRRVQPQKAVLRMTNPDHSDDDDDGK